MAPDLDLAGTPSPDTTTQPEPPAPAAQDTGSKDYEQEARTLGWVPREEFRGDPDHWIDAKTFVERGRQVLPILQANNRRLLEQLNATRSELASLQSSLKAAQATIDAIEAGRAEDLKARVSETIADLKSRIRAASEAGDHAAVAELTEKLVELKQAEVTASARPSKQDGDGKRPTMPTPPPEILDWYRQNPQYVRDVRRAALANAIAAEMRQAGETSVGVPFLEKVAAEVEKVLGGSRPGTSKVEGAANRRSAAPGSGKTYADLPEDAKQACDKMIPRLVGPGKAYKDAESWRRAYAAQYFKDEG